ncbi:MAG TPA: hypothetical protein VLT33_08360 [Labilithrix sp.]|nr:hypothetical protein [Labilithrix sp.]
MSAPDSPKTSERLTWLVLAALSWKFSQLGEQRGIGSAEPLAVLTIVLGATVGLAALVIALSDRAGAWLRSPRILGLFAFFVTAYVVVDVLARAHTVYHFTTDADVFTDYGARLLLAGKNPYDTSLYGAMVAHRVPIELQTPLADGGFSDRLAYPSLSFLLLVPFVALGIPTTLFYGLALCGCLFLLFRRAPVELRPLVLVPFFADTTYLAYSFGGLTDATWALILCLVVVAWKRPMTAAVLVGLACSYKQHAWLLVPFILVRVAKEATPEQRMRAVVKFAAVVGATFVVTQLPFFLWNPRAWMTGVLEPLVASMVPLGEGPSAFLPQSGVAIPKVAFALAFWSAYLALLVVSASWSAGYLLMWIGPSLAFVLNYRSFTSYWIYNVLPLALELCRAALPPSTFTWPYRVRGKTLAMVGGAIVAVAIVVFTAQARQANAQVDVEILSPVRTWGSNVQRIDLKLTNRGSGDLQPRFWAQGVSFQPLPWRIDTGPRSLAPGATSHYSISAIQNISEFDLNHGGNLTVTDARSSLRKMIRFAPDAASLSPHEIANASFGSWDTSIAAPTYWKLVQDRSPGAYLMPASGSPHAALTLHLDGDAARTARRAFTFCPALPSCYAMAGATGRFTAGDIQPGDEHRVAAMTDFAARPEPFAIWAKTPPAANRAPEWEERYGIALVFGRKPLFVFLGGEAGKGTLSDGTPYVVLPGPRGEWTRYTVDLGALQQEYAKDVYPQARTPLLRFPLLDIPAVPVFLSLTYAARGEEARSAEFGAIEDSLHGRDSATRVYRSLEDHPGQVDAWRASYEADLGNLGRANEHIQRARRLESHPQLELQAAHLALVSGRLDDAEASFTRALAFDPMQASVGLGWTLLAQKKLPQARAAFQTALRAVDEAVKLKQAGGAEEVHALVASVGLATVQAAEGDCEGARQALQRLSPQERELREQDILELRACREKR